MKHILKSREILTLDSDEEYSQSVWDTNATLGLIRERDY